jgi:hypothetical protein
LAHDRQPVELVAVQRRVDPDVAARVGAVEDGNRERDLGAGRQARDGDLDLGYGAREDAPVADLEGLADGG